MDLEDFKIELIRLVRGHTSIYTTNCNGIGLFEHDFDTLVMGQIEDLQREVEVRDMAVERLEEQIEKLKDKVLEAFDE